MFAVDVLCTLRVALQGGLGFCRFYLLEVSFVVIPLLRISTVGVEFIQTHMCYVKCGSCVRNTEF